MESGLTRCFATFGCSGCDPRCSESSRTAIRPPILASSTRMEADHEWRTPISAEKALDDLLATLQGERPLPRWSSASCSSSQSATPVRSNLADALDTEPKAISRATRRLAMRGLIGRRFAERGRDSHFVLSIRSAGLLELVPLVERSAGAHHAGRPTSGSERDAQAGRGSDPAERMLRRPVAGVGCPRDDHERRTRRAQESARDAAEKDGAQRAVSARTEHQHAHLPGRAAQGVRGASVE